ncbi:TPA: porin [Escherichia coli]|nr:porin [Escherichia coli]HAX5120959.1 porin [Escherichia coli]HAX5131100.1 porin [Escherichia coli]HAX5181995.1 porin [Escherichia coli]HAX5228663.1 porin [Escherichia coli]
MKFTNFITLLFISIPSAGICSDLTSESTKSALKIEDFFPEKQKWTINTGINIINSKSTSTTPIYFINQVSPDGYLIDRTTSTYNKENNGISGYTSVMYGITNGLSASLSANAQWLNTKYSSTHSQDTSDHNYFSFNGIGLGASYQFYSISDYSIIHGGVNVKDGINSYYLGSTLNWLYDPLVLSLSMAYLDGISKDRFSTNYKIYSTAGTISFAVNPEATLHFGTIKDFISSQTSLSSNTAIVTGVSLNTSKRVTTHVKIKYGSGGDNSTLSLSLTYKI